MKLIDKDDLVAEINKRIIDAPINNIGHQRVWAYNDVKDIINSLEVKEVDLEKDTKMIIIERTWREPNPRGGSKLHKEERKCFFGDDKDGINEFINAQAYVPGYEWTDVEYKYIKV